MANTKSIGVAFSDQDISGSDVIETSGTLGYTAAAQGTVTQLTDKSTAVTLNNSFISSNDTVILTISGGQATPGSYNVFANSLSAGAVSITLRNISGGSLSEAIVINFALIHCA